MERDLTVGNPARALWQFCLPLFGSVIFQQLYNIADSLIAGKFIGDNALAAVGNSYEITLIFLAFAFGVNIGCSVVVSRLMGAKRYADVKTAVYTSWIAGAALCVALMLFGFLACNALLRLIRTPESIFADCALYLYIYIAGLPFLFFYNISTGIFSAMGDSTTPFLFLAASSTANVVLDVVFVAVFQMGVAGVAWATFICQGISCILAVILVMVRLRRIKTEEKVKIFSLSQLKDLAVIAVPGILQQSFISVGNIVIQGVINGFGESVIAGYSAAIKLNNLVITSFTTLGNGVSTFTAQNRGANKPERIKQGFRAGMGMVWLLCVPICALYLGAGKYLLSLFLKDATSAALSEGVLILRILSPFYFVVSAKLTADGVLRGERKMIFFMISTFTDLLLRVALALLLSWFLASSLGVWLAWPIGWTAGAVLSNIFYRLLWKKKTA
ncbi:MAG: MATE family efflux transporter [Clostridia bacterium]|nr:MATE family efflux transporter [Clostridia bacterium]